MAEPTLDRVLLLITAAGGNVIAECLRAARDANAIFLIIQTMHGKRQSCSLGKLADAAASEWAESQPEKVRAPPLTAAAADEISTAKSNLAEGIPPEIELCN